MKTTMANHKNQLSIVDLFKKNSKPRSKLFIQMIPPGISEDDFMELILSEYKKDINYIAFRPGKIFRDSYGHLIGSDCPDYGYATINFINPKLCPKFFKEFNQFQLIDSYGIKSKLFIEFALIQDIPSQITIETDKTKSGYFRETNLFKEFLKKFPFAAKIEEDRLKLISDCDESRQIINKLNFDEEEFEMIENQKLQLPPKKVNELDVKIDLNLNLTVPKAVSFSSLISAKNNSVKRKIVTPLVEYINSMSLNENKTTISEPDETIAELEVNIPLKYEKDKNYTKNKIRNEKEKEKNNIKEKEKESRENNIKDSKPNEKIIKVTVAQPKKNQIKNSTTTAEIARATPKEQQGQKQKQKQPKQKEKEKLVENKEGVTQIKGIPKILGRKQAVTESSVAKSTVNTERNVYNEAEILKRPVREPYIRPEEKKNFNEPVKKLEMKELKTKGPDSKKQEIKKPDTKKHQIKKPDSEGKKIQDIVKPDSGGKKIQDIVIKKQEIIKIKTQESIISTQPPSTPLPAIKKVFTSASNLRDLEKNES